MVWPGDTNNDGVINENDILPIAIYWQFTGSVRPNVSLRLEAQPLPPWNPSAATYADADGNGVVNAWDILPVGLNWHKTHPVRSSKIASVMSIYDQSTDHSQHLEAYRAMYRILENNSALQGKHLCNLSENNFHQNSACKLL
jgi:hypothetical protein